MMTKSMTPMQTLLLSEIERAGAVLADPPWQYKVWSRKGEGRSACQHYRISTFEDLAAIPVRDLARADCWLFLWSTTPHLPFALQLMQRWGFEYSGTAFVWRSSIPRASDSTWGWAKRRERMPSCVCSAASANPSD